MPSTDDEPGPPLNHCTTGLLAQSSSALHVTNQ